jgi:hypothetical protein
MSADGDRMKYASRLEWRCLHKVQLRFGSNFSRSHSVGLKISQQVWLNMCHCKVALCYVGGGPQKIPPAHSYNLNGTRVNAILYPL